MNAREESSDDGDECKGEAHDGNGEMREARFEEMLAGKGGCYKDTASEHRVRRGVGGFQSTINENGTVVDHDQLKEKVEKHDEHIEDREEQNFTVDSPNGFSNCQLIKSDAGEECGSAEGDQAEIFREVIPQQPPRRQEASAN